MTGADATSRDVCRILVPVDGSANSTRAVQLVARFHARLAPLEVRLLHVLVPSGPIGGEPAIGQPGEAAARDALTAAKGLLDAAGASCTMEIATGYVGATIASHAREHGCDGIVMGTRGMGSTEELLGSIARQVIQLAQMPVTLVK
jgi:nucleotide-binding universal stress UspA family protein